MKMYRVILFFVVLSAWVYADDNAKAAKDEVSNFAPPSRQGYFFDIIRDKVYTNYQFGVLAAKGFRQCYYQSANNKTTLYFTFETLITKGFTSSSNLVSASVIFLKDNVETLKAFKNTKKGNYTHNVEKEGLYALCIDTTKAPDPVTYVQIGIDIWRGSMIDEILEDDKEANSTIFNIFDGLYEVTRSMLDIKSTVTHTRSLIRNDYSLTASNLNMINNYSVVSIVLIIAACFIQLHVVKKMFGSPKSIVV